MIIKLVANQRENDPHTVLSWMAIQTARPVMRKSFLNQIKAALSYTPSQVKPQARLLWLSSKKDRLCSYKSTLGLQKLWGGELHLHESAGHDLPLDDASWVISKMKTWLQKEE